MIYLKRLIFLLLIITSCQSPGLLTIEGSITNSLTEVSAAETALNTNILWTIQDAGNSNNLFGLNMKGHIEKNIDISNVKNTDWEDLTSDKLGNIYIGDFGNNNKKRKNFRILKVNHDDLNKESAIAEIIEFKLPKDIKSKDFEAFFIHNNIFYIISKENKSFCVFKVPNEIGRHKAMLKSDYKFKGRNNKITAADISEDGKTVILLNHDKLWQLSDFKGDNFFSGTIKNLSFKHNSQKEGVCFKSASTVLITDERNGAEGGNIYTFSIN